MRLTQMLAVLNDEVRPSQYKFLSHYDPMLNKSLIESKALSGKPNLTTEPAELAETEDEI